MASNTIKETCSCGATLYFTETYTKNLDSNIAYRQTRFQQAHEGCRLSQRLPQTKANKDVHKNAPNHER